MAFGKKRYVMMQALSQLDKNADYSGDSDIQEIAGRLENGREQFREVLSKILGAVMEISKLDLAIVEYPKELEKVANEVDDATTSISEDVSTTVDLVAQVMQQQEEFTSTISTCSADSSEVVGRISEGQRELASIRDLSVHTSEKSREMQKDMSELNDIIQNINSVIDGINAISSQTNLLALNASIEAARAGEAGRGFAVVAEEIRKLAEETQGLTKSMGDFLTGIQKASETSSKSAQETVDALGSMTEKIGHVWEMNETNQRSLETVNNNINELSAMSEEIASLVADVESRSSNISDRCKLLEDNTERMQKVTDKLRETTKPVHLIEEGMDDAAKIMGNMANDPYFFIGREGYARYVTNAISAHKGWLTSLKNMVDSETIMPLQSNAHKCGFGHFYYSVHPSADMGFKQIWDGLEEKHRHFHAFGDRAVKALQSQSFDEARRIYREAEDYSQTLLSDLNKIKQILES